jgi:hypothetical protein
MAGGSSIPAGREEGPPALLDRAAELPGKEHGVGIRSM